jgi:hypothetical protein
MRAYTVQYQQSLLDIALQECGDVLAIIDIALLNNISITEDLEAGQVLLLPEATKPEVVKYYRDRKITLATDIPRPNKPQTIFFPPIPQPWLIGNVYNLEAIATSGLPVSYTSSNTNVATIVGNTLTIVGAGSVTITALQNGNEVYYPAAPVSQNLVIDDIYYGFPASFRDAIVFRFNAKDTPNFVLREDTGEFFVVSYTDPISGITISQPTASLQPKRLPAGKINFNGHFLINASINLNAQSVAGCFGIIQLPLTYPNNPSDTYCFTDSDNEIGIYGSAGTSNVRTDILQNIKINNVASIILQDNCTVYGERLLPASSFTYLAVGAQLEYPTGFAFRYVIAEIRDIIYFNRVLTNTERAELQAYLESYHNLNP